MPIKEDKRNHDFEWEFEKNKEESTLKYEIDRLCNEAGKRELKIKDLEKDLIIIKI